jgi:hypothetical protein
VDEHSFDGEAFVDMVIVHEGRTVKRFGAMTRYGLRRH